MAEVNVNFMTITFILKLILCWTSILNLFWRKNSKGKRKICNLSHSKDHYCKVCVYRLVRTIVFWSSSRLISFPSSQCSDICFLSGVAAPGDLVWGGWAVIRAAITKRHGTEMTQICPWTQTLRLCQEVRNIHYSA